MPARRPIFARALRVLFALGFVLAAQAARAFPTDAEVREMLRQRVEVSKRGVGLVVALVDANGARVVAYGHARRGNDELVNGDSVFEVGSVTKVFTSLLLADMVEKGEVKLEDPLALHVPKWVRSPATKQITLLHLARHTSTLPSWPDNLDPSDPLRHAEGYTNKALFEFLDGYKGGRLAGRHHSYSSYGMALLGELLALRAGTDFESALRERIFQPLGMARTGFALTPDLRAAHALGHSSRGRPRALGGPRGMLGSGALRSSANDLVRFIEANLGLRATPLYAAMKATHETHADLQLPGLSMGLGWFHSEFAGRRITGHNGGTIGFRSYLGLDVAGRRGVVVLANSDSDVTNLGNHLLEPSIPLHVPDPPRDFNSLPVDIRMLDEYVGTYGRRPADREFVRFHREGGQLYATSGIETVRVFSQAPDAFFTEDQENWGSFSRDSAGRVKGIDWFREGYHLRLPRIETPEKK